MHTTGRSCKSSACTCTSPTSLLPCCLLLNSKSGAPFAIIVKLILPGNLPPASAQFFTPAPCAPWSCLLPDSKSGAPFAIIVNLIIPGNPMLALVATFITERHPNDALGPKAPANPMSEPHDWEPFDFVLHKWVVWKVWGVWEAVRAALCHTRSHARGTGRLAFTLVLQGGITDCRWCAFGSCCSEAKPFTKPAPQAFGMRGIT